ncbi:MAG: aldehyde dehydrogenase family protein, partial [Deltaproteobacteria bacterium]|nr:aldehyde dehydrogenase family protein [Deltaproteobacteria bacterium]
MQMLINGKSVGAKETFDVLNPATLERIDSAPRATTAELDQAVEAASAAFAGWRRDLDVRRKALQQGAALIREHRDEIARLLVQEQGKPLAEATGEVV